MSLIAFFVATIYGTVNIQLILILILIRTHEYKRITGWGAFKLSTVIRFVSVQNCESSEQDSSLFFFEVSLMILSYILPIVDNKTIKTTQRKGKIIERKCIKCCL